MKNKHVFASHCCAKSALLQLDIVNFSSSSSEWPGKNMHNTFRQTAIKKKF